MDPDKNLKERLRLAEVIVSEDFDHYSGRDTTVRLAELTLSREEGLNMKDMIEFKVMQVTDRGMVKVGHAYVDATRLWPPSDGMPPVEIFLTDTLYPVGVPCSTPEEIENCNHIHDCRDREQDQIVLQLTWPLKGEHADGT